MFTIARFCQRRVALPNFGILQFVHRFSRSDSLNCLSAHRYIVKLHCSPLPTCFDCIQYVNEYIQVIEGSVLERGHHTICTFSKSVKYVKNSVIDKVL